MSKLAKFSRRPRRTVLLSTAGVAAGLAVSAALVWQASYSAFSATTSSPTNNWSAGTVSLTNDNSGTALFTVTNVKPGSTGTKCVVVTSTSTYATNVKLYATASSFSQTKTLADNMTLSVTQGTSASTGGTCVGFVADTGAGTTASGSLSSFASTYTNFATGFGTWAPAASPPSTTKTYQITYTLNNAATQAQTDAMQGGTAQIGFTWEAQTS